MIAVLIAVAVAFGVCVLSTPLLIRVLHRRSIGQSIRDDGPVAHPHEAKAGTPTMGGIALVAAAFVGYLAAHVRTEAIKFADTALCLWFLILGMAIVGFVDDWLGVRRSVHVAMALLLLNRHATVTICHSRTKDLPAVAREADILVAALGRPCFVTADFVKPGATVIDVGTTPCSDRAVIESLFPPDHKRRAAFEKSGKGNQRGDSPASCNDNDFSRAHSRIRPEATNAFVRERNFPRGRERLPRSLVVFFCEDKRSF